MRIGIDAKFLTHPQKGGFKTYTENLITAMAGIDRDNEYILYLDREPLESTPLPDQKNFTFRVVSSGQNVSGMPWREQYVLPRHIVKDDIDVFHGPCLTAPLLLRVPSVVTIHDMIWYYPTRYSSSRLQFNKRKLMEWYYRWVPEIATRRAAAIITVSNASKQSIIHYMKIPEERIFVTYEATKNIFQPVSQTGLTNILLEKYGLQSNYVLGVGSADPRKNIKTLIRAYAILPESLKQSFQLVIMWNHQFLASEAFLEVQKLGILERVKFLDNVSDEDLVLLYNRASLFVFPSLEEGFGLPPLEAMACGTPVLAADNSSLPEIVGEAALQFPAEHVDKLKELISTVLTSPELQQSMRTRGIERAATFSWKRCGMETIEVYRKAVNCQ